MDVLLGTISSKKSDCVLGKSWGYTENFVWVDKGCRASFNIEYALQNHFTHLKSMGDVFFVSPSKYEIVSRSIRP